jgi:Rab-GTPase-TBC domain
VSVVYFIRMRLLCVWMSLLVAVEDKMVEEGFVLVEGSIQGSVVDASQMDDSWEMVEHVRMEMYRNKFQEIAISQELVFIDSEVLDEIEADVARSPLETAEKDKLRAVLIRFASISISGYTQGLNLIVSVLLKMGFNENESYQGLVYLTRNVGPLFYDENFQGVHNHISKILEMIKLLFPGSYEIIEHISSVCGSTENSQIIMELLFPEILTFYTARDLHMENLVKIWDFLIEKENPQMGYVALNTLVVVKCIETVQFTMNSEATAALDPEEFLKCLYMMDAQAWKLLIYEAGIIAGSTNESSKLLI